MDRTRGAGGRGWINGTSALEFTLTLLGMDFEGMVTAGRGGVDTTPRAGPGTARVETKGGREGTRDIWILLRLKTINHKTNNNNNKLIN